ncbi:PIN domain-like protein, partial [Elsinoe ampelina]
MGVTGLWDFLGEGTVVSLAELSSKHFQKENRRFCIAIDEACWRFNNLTDQQVKQIQAKEPRANPVEKAILYRILGLLRLNFTLIFVFDGPGRPWKRGRRGGGKIDYERLRLLKSMLDHFGVQFIVAPGEAEAECARLQRLGIVDAVWS